MKRTAERLERNLVANGFSAAAITGDVDQRRRLRILGDFKEGTLPILVATDVASRGLHIDGVTHVINYDLPVRRRGLRAPRRPHRARRRVGSRASALACEDYVDGLEAIERYIGFKLPHDFPDDSMLAHDMKHPPRQHREDGRDRRGRPERRGHPAPPRASHTSEPPRPKPAPAPVAAPAPAAGEPKKRRRRRRRRGSGEGATTPTRPS